MPTTKAKPALRWKHDRLTGTHTANGRGRVRWTIGKPRRSDSLWHLEIDCRHKCSGPTVAGLKQIAEKLNQWIAET